MRILSNCLRSFPFLAALALAGLSAPADARARAPAKAPGDPAVQAVERCRSSDREKERACYTAALDERVEGSGPASALQLLDRLAALDPDVRRYGHMYAHRIGVAALKSPSDVGRVFATCTPAYQSGCHHGVIQSYFMAVERSGAGLTAQSADALCADYRGTRRDLLFQCAHGLGHGLAILHGHDLPAALAACDMLGRGEEREMCYAGAFMESLVHATDPDHVGAHGGKAAVATAGNAAATDHSGPGMHDHHGAAAAATAPAKPPFRALDPDDLHYPCSALAEKYLVACYTIQTSAMLHLTRQDVARTAAECGRAPEKARTACFRSLGRDASTLSLGDNEKAVRMCGLAEAAFRPTCHRGVVEAIVNRNADPAQGIPYCKAVPEAQSKRACYVAVGLQALVLPDGRIRREQACSTAEPDLLEACLGRLAAAAPPSGSD
jgi:hypothetical protein